MSKEKWAKLRWILERWRLASRRQDPWLSHKELLADWGFLVYMCCTYLAMIPYLKGFHLTIEMWWGRRDAEGWKLKGGDGSTVISLQSLTSMDGTRAGGHGLNLDRAATYSPAIAEDENKAAVNHRLVTKLREGHVYAPLDGRTNPTPRFKDDIDALWQLSNFALPPLWVVRPASVVHMYYGLGDASGNQFATLSKSYSCKSHLSKGKQDAQGVWFRIGLWTAEEEEESSNFKELKSLVDTVAEEAGAERLRGCKFFLLTDDSTAKGCFYRGSLKSQHLHTLVLSLWMLEMMFGKTIHIIHISGKRMIVQSTDGCSRGSPMEGVMARSDMLTFLDLSQGGIKHHLPLLDWICSWSGCLDLETLSPEGWFKEGHGVTGGKLDGHKIGSQLTARGTKCFCGRQWWMWQWRSY
jgi:hypothetical protein